MLVDSTGFAISKEAVKRFNIPGVFHPTLTNTEMLRMLPKCISGYRLVLEYSEDYCFIRYISMYNSTVRLKDVVKPGCLVKDNPPVSSGGFTLKAALFGMLKLLQVNKLILGY